MVNRRPASHARSASVLKRELDVVRSRFPVAFCVLSDQDIELIVIDHGFGLETRYGHLLNYSVKNGAKVKRGDVIGRVGNTGRSTGFHLHYEVLANGKLLNPLQLLSKQRPRAE